MAPKHVREHGHFTVSLLSSDEARDVVVDESLPCHNKVLRPILEMAKECYVYGIASESIIYAQSSSILSAVRGKHQISLDGDPITGHERLWNAHCGERGTIVILIPAERFNVQELLGGCRDVGMVSNFGSAHTPAAIRFARDSTRDQPMVAACLPRNNGIQWMDIFASHKLAERLWSSAYKVLPLSR
jgi:hypothetical protein